MSRLGARALTIVIAIALAAAHAPSALAQPRPSSPLVRLALPQDDGSLTPYTFELAYPLVTLVYDTLLWRDDQGVPQPWLARSVETSADGMQVTVRLAPGLRWHDGMPLTAADVAFTFRFVAARYHPRFTPQLATVAGVATPDASTVVIALRRPSASFADQPLADLPILPAHLWQGLPADRLAPDGLAIGSGPYRLVEYRPGQGYRFEANAAYFRGPPAVAAIEVAVIVSVEGTLRALERGEVDMVPASLRKPDVERLDKVGTRVVAGPSYLGTAVVFNLRHRPFDDPQVRQAARRALELSRVSGAVGAAEVADRGMLHPASAWAPNEVTHTFDEPYARAALAGRRLPPVEVLAPDNDPAKVEASRQVALSWRRVGLDAQAKALPAQDFSQALARSRAGASFRAAIVSTPALASYDPAFLERLFGSDPARAPLNYGGYASADFDERVRRLEASTDAGQRRGAVAQALQVLTTDAPAIPLYFATGMYAYRPAAYDGWVFVKGSGILDKRSFLEPRTPPSRPPPGGVPGGGAAKRFPFGLVALALVAAAGVVAALALVTRRRSWPV